MVLKTKENVISNCQLHSFFLPDSHTRLRSTGWQLWLDSGKERVNHLFLFSLSMLGFCLILFSSVFLYRFLLLVHVLLLKRRFCLNCYEYLQHRVYTCIRIFMIFS